jgi:hypothetical protein
LEQGSTYVSHAEEKQSSKNIDNQGDKVMSTAAPLQNTAAKSPSVSKSSHAGLLLQRKCACGGPAALSLSGECEECNYKRLQKKLSIGASNDPLEQEADRVANQVLAAQPRSSAGSAPPRIQRYAGQAEAVTAIVPASVNRVISGSGRPLEPALRKDMEQRFRYDFSRVRVHSGSAAEQSAREVNAHAYTVGQNIVFGEGQSAPGTRQGRHLLAHELTHVLQQLGREPVVHRQVYGPKATATPANWKDKVAKAATSLDRAALIESAVSPVKVVDKTADAAADTAVDPNHCIKWDDTNPKVSYDDGLNAKRGRSSSAGFTKEVTNGPPTAKKTDFYIVLGPKALDGKDLMTTTLILNHEFDHVRGTRGGSKLTGDETEIETWTTTFVREFHRSYSIRERSDGVTSYIDPGYATFTQLGGYYARSTDATVKAGAVKKIADYYNTIIKPHAVHDKVFRYWIYRGINALNIAELCGDVNDKVGKIVDPTKDVKNYWEMPTAIVKAATFTGPPAVAVP